jgi:hypothetical protein
VFTANNTEIDEDLVEQPESVTHDFGQHTVTVSTITDEDMGRDFVICARPTEVHVGLYNIATNLLKPQV